MDFSLYVCWISAQNSKSIYSKEIYYSLEGCINKLIFTVDLLTTMGFFSWLSTVSGETSQHTHAFFKMAFPLNNSRICLSDKRDETTSWSWDDGNHFSYSVRGCDALAQSLDRHTVLLRRITKSNWLELKPTDTGRSLNSGWFLNTLPLILLCSLVITDCTGRESGSHTG